MYRGVFCRWAVEAELAANKNYLRETVIISEIIYIVTVLFSAIAAILAWVAKLRWSKEYSEAKNEIIRSKEASIELLERQIEQYKDLTPMRIREYFESVKSQLEEYNDELQQRIAGLEDEAEEKERRIVGLKTSEAQNAQLIAELHQAKQGEEEEKRLKDELEEVKEKQRQAILLYDNLKSLLGKDFDDGVVFQTRTSGGFVQTGEKKEYIANFFVIEKGQVKENRLTSFKRYSFGSAITGARQKYEDLGSGRPYVFILTEKGSGNLSTRYQGYNQFVQADVKIPQDGEWILGGAGTDHSFEVIIRPKEQNGS